MRKADAFPNKWLKADTLINAAGKPIAPVLTIDSVGSQMFGKGTNDEKVLRVLRFRETDRELLLNMGNWDSCALISGQDDDEKWSGHKVQLYREMVDSPKGRVWGVRIRPQGGWDSFQGPAAPDRPGLAVVAPANMEPEEAEAEPDTLDDDLPF